jgi:hypothetical protein
MDIPTKIIALSGMVFLLCACIFDIIVDEYGVSYFDKFTNIIIILLGASLGTCFFTLLYIVFRRIILL